MKKLFAFLICAIMCVTLLASCDSSKHEHTYGDWISSEDGHFHPYTCGCQQEEIYNLHIDGNEDGLCDECGYEYVFIFKLKYDESGYELDRVGPGYKGGDIVIPSEYKGLPVVEIGYSAFSSNYKLTSVVIPDTVTLIDSDAFEKQTDLTSVYVGKGVVTVGVSAFEGCTNLKTVVISDATEYIYAGAFRDCTSLEAVTVGKNVKEITGYVFRGCTSLKTITIPASILEMGAWVFEDTDMTDVYFGVSSPGENWHEEWADGLEGVNIHWADTER
ncbi:MAG: leucine-rich repeat domain-containing protein [Clostridia bacterium]|nr:leucine-rich repeat domain-containing protein [Clostridia bacterium]